MTTHFIEAELNLEESPLAMQKAIEAELAQRGEPLRWSVTDVDETTSKVRVEAVVTTVADRQA